MIKIDQVIALKEFKKKKIVLLKAEWEKYIISGIFPTMDEAIPKFNQIYKNIRDCSTKTEVQDIVIKF